MSGSYIHVYIPPDDEELLQWVARLKRDNVVITATVRDILRAHIRGERKMTEESIAVAVVQRLKESGLVLTAQAAPAEDEMDRMEAVLRRSAEEFV